ncbi:MAG TPA: hypothetical protein VIH06_13145 [Ilumatobacteraceae bacterium]
MTRTWRILAVAIAATGLLIPSGRAAATAATTIPPNTGPVATNDLLPENNDVTNCIGTAEPANCGSKARADGHTYLVFLALVLGMGFIGWRIWRGVRARDNANKPVP